MAKFIARKQNSDPYKGFRIRIRWDGRYVAGLKKMSVLAETAERVGHRPNRDQRSSRKPLNRTKFKAIVLEDGVTFDPEFGEWANKIRNCDVRLGTGATPRDFRRDMVVEVYDEAGKLAQAYRIYRCWVSEYQALPDLDADANAVSIQHIEIENEGWDRDTGAPEQSEPL